MNHHALAAGLLIGAAGLWYMSQARAAAVEAEGEAAGLDWLPDPLAEVNRIGKILSGETMQLSPEGLQFIASREGYSATPYGDFKGYSIGYGHLMQAGESWDYISREDALALLRQDAQAAENAVNSRVRVPVTQSQFDALVSFAFNVGAGAFGNSTLLKLLNAGDYDGAALQFAKWKMAGGTVNDGLVRRRALEVALFNGGVYA